MKHIFYFIGVLFIIYEMIWLVSPVAQIATNKYLKRKTRVYDENKIKFSDRSRKYKDSFFTKLAISMTFLIWMICGLFTFNWVIFMLFLLLQFLVMAPLSKASEYNMFHIILHWFNSLIGLALGVFVILNSYHLKIDLYQWIMNIIN